VGLFEDNLTIKVIMAIEFIKVRLSTGEALESIATHVAEGGFGKLSQLFSSALGRASIGGDIREELESLRDSTKHSGLKRVLSILLDEEGEVVPLLDDLSNDLLAERQQSVNTFLTRFEQFSGWPVKLAVAGLGVLALDMLAGIEGLSALAFDSRFKTVLYGAIAALILLSMVSMRYKE